MRIGIFTDTYPPFINGVSTSIVNLEKALRQKGHEVFIVTVNPEDMSYRYEEDERIIRIPGIPIGIYDYRLTGIYPLKAINKIKNWNLDIIHSHTEFGIGTFARILAKQFNIPLVHTYHTMYEDYIHYITKGHFDKSSKKIVEYLTMFYCDKTAKELIVPSKKTYNLFKEKYHVEKDIRIVPTGIEVERFFEERFTKEEILSLKKELGLKETDFVIMYVGRLAQEKNIELLLKAQEKIVKKNKNAKLVIIGSGPDYEKFITWTLDKKLEENIIFTNAIPWEEIPKYYQVADIFVTASVTETQGLTVIEAMAASKPVICIRDDAFLDVVVDDLNGKIFENSKEYEMIIQDLIDHPEIVKRMSRQARYTSEQHSLKYYALNILDVYESCLKTEKKKDTWKDKLKGRINKLKKN
jgi:1,2-diacylglycerol 3-alpha-glucosyltransferase